MNPRIKKKIIASNDKFSVVGEQWFKYYRSLNEQKETLIRYIVEVSLFLSEILYPVETSAFDLQIGLQKKYRPCRGETAQVFFY